MLGFAPLAAAPLGALGEAGFAYDVSFSDAATITDGGVVGIPVYAASVTEAYAGAMSATVTASTFSAVVLVNAITTDTAFSLGVFESSISDGADGDVTVAALIGFLVGVSESGVAIDSVLVEASDFNATAADGAQLTDSARTSAIMNGAVSNAAEIDDANSASYLWNVINSAQSTNWNSVNTSQASSWNNIDTAQPSSWSTVKTQN